MVLRLQLPLSPAIVVFRRGESHGLKRFRAFEKFVSPFSRKKTRQECVIRLADQNELVALFLNNHLKDPVLDTTAQPTGAAVLHRMAAQGVANDYALCIGVNPVGLKGKIGQFSAFSVGQKPSYRPFLAMMTCPNGLLQTGKT